jgi:cytochrome c-type biogenesis protein CcmE
MSHKGLKILLTAGALSVAFAGLLWTTMQDGTQFYMEVEEVTVDPAAWNGKALQVHGFAANVMRHPKSLDWRFEITDSVTDRRHTVTAVYTGIVPDTFADHAEVVATGRLDGDTFHVDPNGIMAKCPSKYEEKRSVGLDALPDEHNTFTAGAAGN